MLFDKAGASSLLRVGMPLQSMLARIRHNFRWGQVAWHLNKACR